MEINDDVASRHVFFKLLRGENPAVASLFTIMLLHFTAVAMVGPAAAYFAMNDIGLNSREVGLMMSGQAFVQFGAAWVCGRLSDAIGRKLCICGCFAAACGGMILLAFAHTRAELWAAVLVQGLMSGFYPVSDAIILDSVDPAERPSYTGLYGAVFGVTFTVGNGLGATLLHLGMLNRNLFLLGAAQSSLAVLYGICRMTESFADSKRRPVTGSEGEWDWAVVGIGLICIWLCNFFYGLADGFMSMYPFLVQDLFSWTDAHFATAMGCVGLCAGLIMLFVFPPLAKHFGAAATLGTGCFCGGVAYACFPQTLTLHLVGLAFFCASVALFNPSVPVVVGMFAGDRHFGFASGVGSAARNLSGAFSPMIAGHLYANSPGNMVVGSAFFLAAVVASVGVCISPAEHTPREAKPLAREV